MNARTDAPWTDSVPSEAATLRLPPNSTEAEQSVLGGLLLDNFAWDRVADLLTESDFYRADHRLIFGAIGHLIGACKPADVITVFEHLQAIGRADDAGGLPYINAIGASVVGSANIRRYAEIVRERSVLRRLIAVSDETAAAAFNTQGKTSSEIIEAASSALSGLERQQAKGMPTPLSQLVVQQLDHYTALAEGNVAPGQPTGFDRLDEMLAGGLRPGLYIIAARPSVGKSSFSQQIALQVAKSGAPALFLSQEMGDRQIANRAVANLAGVSLTGLMRGRLSSAEWGRIAEGVDRLKGLDFHVDDQPALRLSEIRGKARAVKGLRLLVVDYLQLCRSDLRGESRNNQIGEISRGLKTLSKQLDIPVIALSQLNRKAEDRAGKRPTMADLRDSGEIEQDADVIVFLWPVREFPEAGQKILGMAIDKNRDGQTGEMALEFRGAYQQWTESDADISQPTRGSKSGGFDA